MATNSEIYAIRVMPADSPDQNTLLIPLRRNRIAVRRLGDKHDTIIEELESGKARAFGTQNTLLDIYLILHRHFVWLLEAKEREAEKHGD